MNNIQAAKSDPLFLTGIGSAGAVLYDIKSGPCLRIDAKRWSLNTSRGSAMLAGA